MKLADLLSVFKTAPKTLDQAKASLGEAQPVLDSVSALFSTAGLDLDALIAAGPDSLKAHIDGLSAKDADLATAQAKVTELEGKLSASVTENAQAKAALDSVTATHAALCQSVSFDASAKDKDGKPVEFAAAFKAHVAKEAALVLAKDGRPPLEHKQTTDPKAVDVSGLSGLAKTTAIFEASLNKPTAK